MLTLYNVKKHLRVETISDDSLITSLITAAYQFAENYTNRVIIQRTETLLIDDFNREIDVTCLWSKDKEFISSSTIELPYLPVISVTSIGYKDVDDSPQVFADYYLNLRDLFAKVMPKQGSSWPSTNQDYENVVITYEVGYVTIPEQINQAVLLIIGSMYEQRENHIIGVSINNIPLSAEYLLNPYRVISV